INLDTRRAKKDGTYPVKLRVFYKSKNKRYSTGLYLTKDDFEKSYVITPVLKRHKEINRKLRDLENELIEILENIGDFSFSKFESRVQTKSSENDLFSSFDLYISKLREEKRLSTAISYRSAKISVQRYFNKKTISFEEVDVAFLRKYENYMVSDGRSVSTVGIYLRYIRNLFNIAIKEKLVKSDYYPFGKGQYQIPNTPKTYKALTMEEVKMLLNESVEEGSAESFYRDLWVFSYYGNGINTKDMSLLQYSNIKDNIIFYKRAKTILTNRTAPEGKIPLIEPLQEIIDKWGNDPLVKDNYIFPVLKPKMTDQQILDTMKATNKQIGKFIRKIAIRAGIKTNISMQHARHTFTTVLAQQGVPLAIISQRLTHGNTSTTDKYIGRISNLKDYDISKLLIPN
ncbi:MAG: site-specific integrase, partial [Bacteroidales bacterium]|nr:site-specific integrase [Bacteroidales bacterium]